MSTASSLSYRPSLGDRVGIVIFMLAGAAIVVWAGIAATLRIIEVLRGEGVTATAHFMDLEVQAPIGPDGSTVPMLLDTATVTAPQLSSVAAGTAIIAAVFGFIVITTIVVCLMLLALGSLRGRIFGKGNTRLIITAGMVTLVGFGLGHVLDSMVAKDILSGVTADDFDGYPVFVAEPMPFVLLAFAFGIVATAYTIGARMQRETEGLI